MGDTVYLKKSFIIALIISLIISALIGVTIFLIGNFGRVELKILYTTLNLSLFSLIGVGFSALYEKKQMLLITAPGLILTIWNFITTILFIWDVASGIFYSKSIMISFVLFFAFLYSSLMLTMWKPEKIIINSSIFFSIFMSSIVAAIIMGYIIYGRGGEIFLRILGAAGILAGLGTVVTPLINKFSSIGNPVISE